MQIIIVNERNILLIPTYVKNTNNGTMTLALNTINTPDPINNKINKYSQNNNRTLIFNSYASYRFHRCRLTIIGPDNPYYFKVNPRKYKI